jgi:hypothetical protein
MKSCAQKTASQDIRVVVREEIFVSHRLPHCSRAKFSAGLRWSDFGVVPECEEGIIFFLTSLFIDSRFQSVAADDRCESMNNGKGE